VKIAMREGPLTRPRHLHEGARRRGARRDIAGRSTCKALSGAWLTDRRRFFLRSGEDTRPRLRARVPRLVFNDLLRPEPRGEKVGEPLFRNILVLAHGEQSFRDGDAEGDRVNRPVPVAGGERRGSLTAMIARRRRSERTRTERHTPGTLVDDNLGIQINTNLT
jgi:hypothetical protein